MTLSSFLKSFKPLAQHNPRRKNVSVNALTVEVVEQRCLLSAVSGAPLFSSGGGGNGNTGHANPLTAIPKLSSLPGAPVTIYLDFDGHTETDPSWTNNGGRTVTTPVYDNDKDLTTFSDDELYRITEIWYRVSEDYAPFNVNVTTVDPGSFNDFSAIRVSIGGDGAWDGGQSGGVALLNSFSSSNASNTAFVFTDNLQDSSGNGAIVPTAMNISHEAGHTFGLQHHSEFDASGKKLQEYNPGSTRVGPIMGGAFYSERNTWNDGPTNIDVATLQDDIAEMTRPQNQTMKLRTDDYGNTTSTAFNLSGSGSKISKTGVIEQKTDQDWFKFETDTGSVTFSVKGLDVSTIFKKAGLNPGTNLDAELRIYNSSGVVIATASPTNSLFATITTNLTQGTYYVGVSSTGEYGSLGQYTLTGTVIPLPSTPTLITPTGTVNSLFPVFQWTVGANAASYQLEVANLTTGNSTYYTQTLTTTTHTALTAFSQGNYQARVRTVATNKSTSAWSNVLLFTVDIPDPVKPKITRPQGAIGESFPVFEWGKNTNDAYYSLWVNNKAGTRVIYGTGLTSTTYTHFSPLPDGDYTAWVRAFNVLGEYSTWSDPVTFKITAPIPTKPVITAPTATTTSIVPRIVWTAVEGAARYDLQIDNLSTQTTEYIREQNLPRTQAFYDPTKELTQGNYVAMVRAVNGNGVVGPWSNAYSFTVDVLPPAVSTLTGPVPAKGSTAIPTVTPTFTWKAVARAATYDLWVNNVTTNQTQIIRKTDLTSTSYTPTTGLPQGDYRAWVRGINVAGEVGLWSPMFTFTIDEPTPSVPSITAPAPNPAGSVENDLPTIKWASDVAAPFYDLEIDNSTLKVSKVVSVTGLKEAQYTIPTAQRFGEYTYLARVRARNSSGDVSAWSAYYTIRIDIPNPTTPVIVGPSDTSSNTTPKFIWTHSAGNVKYEILVRDLVRNESKVILVSNLQLAPGGLNAFYTVPGTSALVPSTYRFWIRGFNSQGMASSWSASQTFVISAKLDDGILKLQGLMEETDTVLLTSLERNAVKKPVVAKDEQTEASETSSPEIVDHSQTGAWTTAQEVVTSTEMVENMELIDAAMSLLSDPRSKALGES